MSFILNLSNHISIKSADEIRLICKPIFDNFSIDYFDYFRVYTDSSRIWLSSNRNWINYLYQQNYWQVSNFKISSSFKLEVFFWKELENYLSGNDRKLYTKKLTDAYNHFDIANGVAFIEKNKNYTGYYNFGTSQIDQFFINNYYNLKLFLSCRPTWKKGQHQVVD
jgi:predicted AlkP superfamily phosphohydrolase/phosphomutase